MSITYKYLNNENIRQYEQMETMSELTNMFNLKFAFFGADLQNYFISRLNGQLTVEGVIDLLNNMFLIPVLEINSIPNNQRVNFRIPYYIAEKNSFRDNFGNVKIDRYQLHDITQKSFIYICIQFNKIYNIPPEVVMTNLLNYWFAINNTPFINNTSIIKPKSINLENIQQNIQQNVDLLLRFQQIDHVHKGLENNLISDVGKSNIINKFYFNNRDFINMSKNVNAFLTSRHIRIASFCYNPQKKAIFLIKPVPLGTFDILTNVDEEIINLLAQDIFVKIKNQNLHNYTIFSYDIYYDRKRHSAGVFHRDMNNLVPEELIRASGYTESAINLFNQPNFVSLEFFAEPNKLYLGPELIYYPEEPGLPNINVDQLTNIIRNSGNRQSLRVLVQNGSIITFNNLITTHATPLTDKNYIDPTALDPSLLFYDNPYRLRQESDINDAIINTERDVRTFIRTYITLLDYNPIEDNNVISEIPIDYIFNILKANGTNDSDFIFRNVEPEKDIKGGKTSLSMPFNNIDNIKPTLIMEPIKGKYKYKEQMSLMKQNNKIEPSTQLTNFKIANAPIKINLDVVVYPEIKKKYVNAMIKKEIEFLKIIMTSKKKSSRTKTKSRTKPKSKSSSRTSSRTKPKSKSRSSSRTKTKSKTSSKTKLKSKTRSKTKPKSKTRSKFNSRSRTRSTSRSKSK